MPRRSWIIASILCVFVIGLSVFSVERYSNKDSIKNISSDTYMQVINATLAPSNTNFSSNKITVGDIQYINNSVALVKLNGESNSQPLSIYAIFELKDGTLYVTNYGPNLTQGDFGTSSDTVDTIINTENTM